MEKTTIKFCFLLMVIWLQFTSTQGNFGVDLSSPATVESFNCLRKNNIDFVIVRAFRSNGIPDTNAPKTIKNARQTGFKNVDAYMFPCPNCGKSAEQQVQDMLRLELDVTTVWLDVEIYNWFSDKNKNRIFFEELVDALENHFPIGVYTSLHNWSTIMGLDYTTASHLPLWYAHFDGTPNFSDFQPFAGWERPTMKQFGENRNICGIKIDDNWMG